MTRVVLLDGFDAKGDVSVTVKLKDIRSVLLEYDVVGLWETGLLKVLCNGKVVADYSGLWGLWPFTGHDRKDVTGFLSDGENVFTFIVKVQVLGSSVISYPVITAVLEGDFVLEQITSVNTEEVGDSGAQIQITLSLILAILILLVVLRILIR